MQSRVLVVDDDKFIRRFLEELLTEAGFDVIQAENGREGVRLAVETDPDIVLLDLVMPGMDGLEVVRGLRSLSRFKFVPIIVLTARSDREKTVNPFHVGADDYLSKPIDRDELIARIRGNLLQKQAMKVLDRKSRDCQALFENAPEGLAAINSRGEVEFANRMALEMVGFSREELCGTSFVSLLDIYSIRQVIRHRRKALHAPAKAAPFDVRIGKRNGEKLLVSVCFNRLPVDGDLHVISFRDVTERRAMEDELKNTRDTLRQANERLRQMDRARADFLNTATHELRIPVTIVNGYCNLLKEMGTDNLTLQQGEFLDEAIKSSDRLVDLINDMLDLSRFEAGKMGMEIGQRNLCGVLETVRREMAPLLNQSRLEMEVAVEPVCQALFDEEKIRRVLTNLIGNAVKFTPAGGTIRMRLEDDGEHVRVCIEDTGKGIPPERLPDLFNEFTQVGKDDTARGSGLGLSICKKIIESHRGRIWAESRPGEGSCFSFTLPKPS